MSLLQDTLLVRGIAHATTCRNNNNNDNNNNNNNNISIVLQAT